MDVEAQRSLLDAVCGVPNGVLAMSPVMPGMVETSTNLASVKFVGELLVEITTSQRSAIQSARDAASASVESVLRLAGADVSRSDPDPDSRLLEVARSVYDKLFGAQPQVRSIHAGLECGLFLQKYPDLEMISIGPTLRGVHSPDEKLEIASVGRFWQFLTGILGALKNAGDR